MKKNLRVGIDCTRRCNWKCKTCFYRWANNFNTPYDKTVEEVINEAVAAKARGCDHVVFVGWGEPSLWQNLLESIRQIGALGMTSSIITNGSVAIGHYEKMREAGLNHLHISVHGVGPTLDQISGIEGSGARQAELFTWLLNEKWPWRMNMTLQKINYESIDRIAETCLAHGCRHIISLGFLPHYEWNDPVKMKEVAVHPELLRPHIEAVARRVEAAARYDEYDVTTMFTIRYHPMCHLSEEYRKYVVNAQYVLYDPWEWDYGTAGMNSESHWKAALDIGGTVRIDGDPCRTCGLQIHCGGWNKVYAAGFAGAGLTAVPMPENTKTRGWLHDQNPANGMKGWF